MGAERLLRELLGDAVVDQLLQDSSNAEIFEGDPAWIEDLLEARRALPLPEVPAVVSQDLRDLFDQELLVARHEAVLVADSRTDRRLAGVRGEASADGWSLTFVCEAADILLDVWPGQDTVRVEGQVMTHGTEQTAFRAKATGPTSADAHSDRLGRFRFPDLERGDYEFVLSNRRTEIVLQSSLEERS